MAIPFTPVCRCLSEGTLKTVGPFYLVSIPGEVTYPTRGEMCNLSSTPPLLEKSKPIGVLTASEEELRSIAGVDFLVNVTSLTNNDAQTIQ